MILLFSGRKLYFFEECCTSWSLRVRQPRRSVTSSQLQLFSPIMDFDEEECQQNKMMLLRFLRSSSGQLFHSRGAAWPVLFLDGPPRCTVTFGTDLSSLWMVGDVAFNPGIKRPLLVCPKTATTATILSIV